MRRLFASVAVIAVVLAGGVEHATHPAPPVVYSSSRPASLPTVGAVPTRSSSAGRSGTWAVADPLARLDPTGPDTATGGSTTLPPASTPPAVSVPVVSAPAVPVSVAPVPSSSPGWPTSVTPPNPVPEVASAPVLTPTPAAGVVPPAASGCAAALAYLAAHAAPGFRFECPGSALGHQAMTCVDVPGVCPGERLIAIAVACPASWMNEASNSWVLTGASRRSIDPYGACP